MRKAGLITFTIIAALGILWFQNGINQAEFFGQQAQAAPGSDEQGERKTTFEGIVSGTMSQWKRGGENRGMGWMAEELAKHKVLPPFNNSHLISLARAKVQPMVR